MSVTQLETLNTTFQQAANAAIDAGATHYIINKTLYAGSWITFSYTFVNCNKTKLNQVWEVGHYIKEMKTYSTADRWMSDKWIEHNLDGRDRHGMIHSALFMLNRGLV
ncbi:hypothetical protein F862_gp102 [Vibrio phage vB_VpaS_MAR10]|uniref:Uncharacterized protein n=1 Tax=Vibrio phage vB_VpaS_MAR10 TaxID=1229755 RepID=K7R2L8_9CAUD|nr:hypothetical protein F862_gp102 [Vibrio phage vB_VpaS_MAR10]AFV81334.1 hypothetical protein MAR10_099 [Vibrio phage vB_VpaS_MAR10]